MFSRLLALAVMAACVAGCNTTRGIGQDFNSVFAPSKNTSNQTMFGNPNPASTGSSTSSGSNGTGG